MVDATIGGMGKRKQHKPATVQPEQSTPDGSADRSKDRHASPFMVRLPEEYRTQLKLWQEQQRKQTRLRPDMVDGVKLALEDFLGAFGLWPPKP